MVQMNKDYLIKEEWVIYNNLRLISQWIIRILINKISKLKEKKKDKVKTFLYDNIRLQNLKVNYKINKDQNNIIKTCNISILIVKISRKTSNKEDRN